MKRITSLMLVAIMLLLSLSVQAAEEQVAVSSEAMGVLAAIEILPTEINPNQSVTRADFAVYVARMFGVNDFDESGDRYYIDVPMDHYALTAINYLTERQILSGTGSKYFYPDNGIGIAEACKILVESIGYGRYAESFGTYPMGYMNAAQRLDIIEGGRTYSSNLTVAETAELIYNTMTIALSETIVEETYQVWIGGERSLLEMYHNVYTVDGVVESTNGRAIYSDNVKEADIISINGRDIKNPMPSVTAALLGDYVRAYYLSTDKGETGELIYIYADPSKVKSFTIDNADYNRISGGYLYYYDDNNREKHIPLDGGYFVVYNGAPYQGANNRDAFNSLGNGSLTFKDTDKNSKYDVVIIEEATDFYTSFIDVKTGVLTDTKLCNDDKDTTKYEVVEIYDAKGNAITIDAIATDSIISVFESAGKRFLKLVVSNKTMTGKIEAYKVVDGEKIITVGGNAYKITDAAIAKANTSVVVGQNLTYYLNSFDEIAFVTAVIPGEMVPGYLVDLAIEEAAFESRLLVKLCDRSGALVILPCAQKVEIDTLTYRDPNLAQQAIPNYNATNENPTPQIVAYKLNSKGEITKIDTTKVCGTEVGGTETEANSLMKNVFSGTEVRTAGYRIGHKSIVDPAKTVHFMVPLDDKAADAKAKDFSAGSLSLSWIGGWYDYLATYRLRGDSVYDDVVVQYARENTTLDKASTIMLVEEIANVVDEDGNDAISITGLRQGATVSYTVEADCEIVNSNPERVYTLEDLGEGDAIRVSEANGRVGVIEMIYDISRGDYTPDWCYTYTTTDGVTTSTIKDKNWYTYSSTNPVYGEDTQISFGYVLNRKDGVVEISYDNDEDIDELFNQLTAVMIYDSEAHTDKVYVGTIADIKDNILYPGNASRILIQTDTNILKGVIVYK